jgi:hypothetical protein
VRKYVICVPDGIITRCLHLTQQLYQLIATSSNLNKLLRVDTLLSTLGYKDFGIFGCHWHLL